MLRLVTWTQGLVALVIATFAASPCRAAQAAQTDSTPLIRLAASKFPNLTKAERALLEFADVGNLNRGEWAAAGPNQNPLDASNDPKDANKWTHDRDIRAALIRWMCVDRAAIEQIDPGGLRVLGARIVGGLNLTFVHVPFAMALERCSIGDPMRLEFVVAPTLDFEGSFTSAIRAGGMTIHGSVFMGGGFQASDEVNLENSRIEGDLNLAGGHFNHLQKQGPWTWESQYNTALNAHTVRVDDSIILCCGFTSDGAVLIGGSTIGADLVCFGSRISNPNNLAFMGSNIDVALNVLMLKSPPFDAFRAEGEVTFFSAHIGGNLFASGATFGGAAQQVHGLSLARASIKGALTWQNVKLENGARLDLSASTVQVLADDEASWPPQGGLQLDGFSYSILVPLDARDRLRWLGLQPGFSPQPYRQLAKVLRESGDDASAVKVLIAAADSRYQQYGLPGRLLGWFLKVTIGYGHRPLLALLWALGIVLVGWVAVFIGKRAGVMAPTWPENKPPDARKSYEELQPLLYSLDAFLPFVNLHQEHYWWPDATVSGECAVLGRNITVGGRALRYYLWLQIVAGWLLSAIFIAGVTGLLRND
jgi:hypothetical protein